MKKYITIFCAGIISVTSFVTSALDEITVGYFLEWPTPNLVDQVNKTFDREMGIVVNWKAFETSDDMNTAMASGEIQIAYSQEHISFIKGVTNGLDIVMTGIAVA